MSPVDKVTQVFRLAKGPALYRHPTNDWFYKHDSGSEYEAALLNLDPRDLTWDDLYSVSHFLPSWATDEGLRWLIPGIVRVAFEPGNNSTGIMDDLFGELRTRLKEDSLVLSAEERQVLERAYEEAWRSTYPYQQMGERGLLKAN